MSIQLNNPKKLIGYERLHTGHRVHKSKLQPYKLPGFSIFHILLITLLMGLVWSFNGLGGLLSNSGFVFAASDPVIAAAGDIACDPTNSNFNSGNGTLANCREKATSNLLMNGGFAAVLPLGDNQYFCGGYQAFLQSYDPTWGRVLSITHPVVGNHEYLTSGGTGCNTANTNAKGYFKYFGAAAGTPGAGFYSYDIGTWHLIALNSNCSDAGGCDLNSAQGKWLEADLAAHSNYCTLAYWHIPLFSSGGRANNNTLSFWNSLYNHNADLVLSGHDHIYERFAPQTPGGIADPARGLREFIVGTGGADHTTIAGLAANSEVQNVDSFGILKLTLHPTSYDWQFIPEAGKAFTDSGTGLCHDATSGTLTPTNEVAATTTATASLTVPPTTITSRLTFIPTADSYTDSSSPNANNGALNQFRIDNSPIVNSYLRFTVQGLNGAVTEATLRVYANSRSSSGYQVYSVPDTSWGETTITYNNAPPFGSLAGSAGAFNGGVWTTVDVTSLITGNGTYSLALTGNNGTAVSFASRESGANAPQLVITLGTSNASPTSGPTITPTATQAINPTDTPTQALTSTFAVTNVPASLTATATQASIPTDTPTPTITSTETNIPASLTPTLVKSPGPTNVPTSSSATTTFLPSVDSYTDNASPNTNYGKSTQIRIDNSPIVNSYLRFNVQGLNGAVTKATLRVFANSQSAAGYLVYAIPDITWGETSITANNAPPFGSQVGSAGVFNSNVWTTVDVTAWITGNGTFSLALTGRNSTAVSLASRESGANAPQLIITTGGNGSNPSATPTPTQVINPTSTPSGTNTPASP